MKFTGPVIIMFCVMILLAPQVYADCEVIWTSTSCEGDVLVKQKLMDLNISDTYLLAENETCPHGCLNISGGLGGECKDPYSVPVEFYVGGAISLAIICFVLVFIAFRFNSENHLPAQLLFLLVAILVAVIDILFLSSFGNPDAINQINSTMLSGVIIMIGLFVTIIFYFLVVFMRQWLMNLRAKKMGEDRG